MEQCDEVATTVYKSRQSCSIAFVTSCSLTMALFLMVLFFHQCLMAVGTNTNYVVLLTGARVGQPCSSLPVVEIATRQAPLNSTRYGQLHDVVQPQQQFSDWRLVAKVFIGECNSTNQTLVHNIQNNTVYQFRVQLSPAHSCHCVNIETVADIKLLNGRWCNDLQNTTTICAAEDATMTYLSEPVAVISTISTTQTVNCSRHFVLDNILSKAVADEGTFARCPRHVSFEDLVNLVDVSPVTALNLLLELPRNTVNNTQRLPLLTRAFTAAQSNGTANSLLLEAYIKVARDAIDEGNINVGDRNASNLLSLLTFLDDIALLHGKNITVNATSIVLVVQEVVSVDGPVLGIAVDGSNITLPAEVFTDKNGSAIVASYYFKNISHLLRKYKYIRPISPILSSTVSCDGCRTSNLSENVNIFFSDIAASNSDRIGCSYTDTRRANDFHVWRGGNFNQSRSIESSSMLCSCNHLTHFAILPRQTVQSVRFPLNVLTTIERVLTPPSLVLLLATIFTFIIHKSLWNMRNYIHIMLCANLFAEQLLWLVGGGRTENKAVCSAIAVLLQYMLLVVFMWMLMEGVFLYVALVRVFISNSGRYIAGFTITSYGLPLVYMAVVVPMGFLVNTDDNGNHYGQYEGNGVLTRCWLSPSRLFTLTYVIPIVVILTINIGFVVMAIVVLCRHHKKNKQKEIHPCKWISVALTLTVVTGLPLIVNTLVVNVHLFFIIYVMAGFTSLQGTIIFILLVPLSKPVRQAYLKWWQAFLKWYKSVTATKPRFVTNTTQPVITPGNGHTTSKEIPAAS